jgi:hypothetical protein
LHARLYVTQVTALQCEVGRAIGKAFERRKGTAWREGPQRGRKLVRSLCKLW